MKQVSPDSITLIDGTDPLDNRYRFDVATKTESPRNVDMAELLLPHRNGRVDHRKNYKLWNDVYPGEKELLIFQETVETALQEGRKVHISNITLREEVEIVRKLYRDLGYFDVAQNRFLPDLAKAPITIGVNIRNLAYSTKDYKSKRESICFVPPPREPGHVKSLFAGINFGLISTIHTNNFTEEQPFLRQIIESEKMNLTTLSEMIYGNFPVLGFDFRQEEWIESL